MENIAVEIIHVKEIIDLLHEQCRKHNIFATRGTDTHLLVSIPKEHLWMLFSFGVAVGQEDEWNKNNKS